MKTLDELAMEYTLIWAGVDPDKMEGTFQLVISYDLVTELAQRLNEMERLWSPWEASQAIKQSKEIVKMMGLINDQNH